MRYWILVMCVVLFLIPPGRAQAEPYSERGLPRSVGDRLVSLDLRDMDIRSALNLIGEQHGLNIVAGDEVEGRVTGHFERVPLGEVLEAVLHACGCTYERVGDIVVVTRAEKGARWGVTRVIQLHHAKGDQIQTAVEKLLSPGGSAQVFPPKEEDEKKTYTEEFGGSEGRFLIIRDEKQRVEEIARVVAALDLAPKQLMIEVRLVETVLGNNRDLGFDWNATASVNGRGSPYDLPLDRDRFRFGTLSIADFALVLRTLDEDNNSRLISNPRITTQDNHEAKITVGTIYPIRTVSRFSEFGMTQDLLTYEDKEITIELSVTPHTHNDGRITMAVKPTVQDIIGWTGEFNDQPITSKRELETRVTVRDGETIAMGGLIKESEIETKKRVWILGRIPLLGRFFTYDISSKETTDMLVFITPHVIAQ